MKNWLMSLLLGLLLLVAVQIFTVILMVFVYSLTAESNDLPQVFVEVSFLVWCFVAFSFLFLSDFIETIRTNPRASQVIFLIIFLPVTLGFAVFWIFSSTVWCQLGMLFSSLLLVYEIRILQSRNNLMSKSSD